MLYCDFVICQSEPISLVVVGRSGRGGGGYTMSKCQKIAEFSKMSKKKLNCQHTRRNVCETRKGKVFKMTDVK